MSSRSIRVLLEILFIHLGNMCLKKKKKFVIKVMLRGCQNVICAFHEILLIPGKTCLPNYFFN